MRVTSAKGSDHRSYLLWRKGLSGLSLYLQSSENGYVMRKRKCGLLMHTSTPTDLLSLQFSFLTQSFYLFFLSPCFLFSILSYFLLSFLSSTVHGYPILYRLSLWDLPILSLNHFQLLVGISPRLPIHLLVVQPLLLPRVCWLHHSLFLNKITCLVSYLSLFLFYLNR